MNESVFDERPGCGPATGGDSWQPPKPGISVVPQDKANTPQVGPKFQRDAIHIAGSKSEQFRDVIGKCAPPGFIRSRRGDAGTIALLAKVACGAGGNEVVVLIGSAITERDSVIDMEDDVGGELTAVLTGELISLKDRPSTGIPGIKRQSVIGVCRHAFSIPDVHREYIDYQSGMCA